MSAKGTFGVHIDASATDDAIDLALDDLLTYLEQEEAVRTILLSAGVSMSDPGSISPDGVVQFDCEAPATCNNDGETMPLDVAAVLVQSALAAVRTITSATAEKADDAAALDQAKAKAVAKSVPKLPSAIVTNNGSVPLDVPRPPRCREKESSTDLTVTLLSRGVMLGGKSGDCLLVIDCAAIDDVGVGDTVIASGARVVHVHYAADPLPVQETITFPPEEGVPSDQGDQ